MELKEIMSVSGQSGLFKYISQARNGIIVETFNDKKRVFVSAATKVSSLEDVAVFAEDREVPLKEVFRNINEKGSEFSIPDTRSSPEDLKEFMHNVLPDYDRKRVYVSDIRKIANWYSIVKNNNLVDFAALLNQEAPEKDKAGEENKTVEESTKKEE
jgi:hypothetical protein